MMGDEPLREPDAISFLRRQRKSQCKSHSQALANPSRRSQRSTLRGYNAKCDLRQTPLSALRRNDKVAAKCENASNADGVTVDRCHDRLGKLRGQNNRTRSAPSRQSLDKMRDRNLAMSSRILEVGARTECTTPLVSGKHDAGDILVILELGQPFLQAGREIIAPCVSRFRTAQCQDRDMTALLVK